MVLLELIQNLALLFTLAIAYQVILQHFPKKSDLFKVISGILFGSVGILTMMTPFNVSEGIIIDGRSVILSMAGFLAGPTVGLIAAILCAAYRLWLGGLGVWVGIGSILGSAAFGIGYYYLSKKVKKPPTIVNVWLFGILVHASLLLLFLFLPDHLGLETIKKTGVQILFLFPAATVILYLIFKDSESRFQEREALKLSEQRFKLASASSILGVWHWDILADKIIWDEHCWRMLGYEPDAFALTFEAWSQLIHPEERQKSIEIVQSSLQQSDSFNIKFRYQTVTGEWLRTEGRGSVIDRDAANRPLLMTGIHLDISQRKQTIEALAQKDKIFTHSLDMLCMAGFDGYFKVLNPAWSHTLGWEINELLENPGWTLFIRMIKVIL